jgi:hypothetical protein
VPGCWRPYFRGGDSLSGQLENHPLQIWRSILDGADVLKQGLAKRIGAKYNTDMCNTNWLALDFMLRLVAFFFLFQEYANVYLSFIEDIENLQISFSMQT